MQILEKYKDENLNNLMKDYELDDLIEFSKTVRVLFVASKNDTLNEILSIFKVFFIKIDIANDGESAFEKFKENRYDLIISSTEIEKMDCIKLLTKIREISRHITILALSSVEKDFIDLIRLGIDGYILTPIEIDQFLQIMKKVITTLLEKEQLFSYRVNLENMLDIKSQELIKVNKELELRIAQEIEKNRLKDLQIFEQVKIAHMGEMITNIAHQWRQPLSAISTLASTTIIENEMKILDDASLKDKMENIISKTKYLSTTINTFKSIANDEDKLLKNSSIKDEIDEAINMLNSNLNHDIKIINNIKLDDTVQSKMIHGEFSQVIINLLNNSKDFLIERNIDNPWIKIELKKENDLAYITIEDNANGIEEDVLPKVFNPYFTTKHQSQGTGLGLHISYRIVTENLNGNISVKNSENGAIFTITLPLSKNI